MRADRDSSGNWLNLGISRRIFLMVSALIHLPSARAQEPETDRTIRIHFLHHSTGGNLIKGAGGIEKMFEAYNQINGTDYRFTHEWSAPNNENYPYDYHTDTFSHKRIREYAENYHLVIWKHCYPGSDIQADLGTPDINSSRKSIENYKLQYRSLRIRFDMYPDTKFLGWTLPPLHRKATTLEKARRASDFTDWVRDEFMSEDGAHINQSFFDARLHLSENDEYLQYDYERDHNSWDSHPNDLANDTVNPHFFQSIIKFVEKPVTVEEHIPAGFQLIPPHPNPFNPVTVIRYRVPRECHVSLRIFDLLGRQVTVLYEGRKSAGEHHSVWNGRDIAGNSVSSGVYFYSFAAAEYRTRGKLTLLR